MFADNFKNFDLQQQIILDIQYLSLQQNFHTSYYFRMYFKTICLISLVFLAAASAGWVSELDQQTFKTEVLPTKSVWLLYSTGQSSGEKYQLLEKVSQVLRGMFRVGIIKPGELQKQGTLNVYGDNRDEPITFDGEFTVKDIVSFVLKNTDQFLKERSAIAKSLKDQQQFQEKQATRAAKQWNDQQELRKKSDTILLDTKNWNSFLNARDAYLIHFYQANCSACIELSKQWEGVASQLKGSVRVAKINMTQIGNQQLQQQLLIEHYPVVRFYPYGNKNVKQFSVYEGINKKFSIIEWAKQRLSQKIEKAEIPALNKENYETLCKNSKGTCVIVFLDQASKGKLSQIQALAAKHVKKPITFLVSNKGEQSAFQKQANVESFPDVVMMFCKRKQIWHNGGLDLGVIDSTIEDIALGNRLGFSKYKFEEQIV